MASRKNKVTSKPKNDARWRVAVHEAGHAVAAHALGIGIEYVTIVDGRTEDGERYAGFTKLKYDLKALRSAFDEYYEAENDDEEEREAKRLFLLLKIMQVSYAGKVTEELFFGEAKDAGLTPDLESVNTCALLLCPPDAKEIDERLQPVSLDMDMDEIMNEAIKRMQDQPKQEFMFFQDWVEHRTRKLLRNRRDLIEAVASRLLERETVSGAEVVSTIDAALNAAFKKRRSRNLRPLAPEAPPADGS